MADQADSLSTDEYARWLTPSETLTALSSLGFNVALDALLRRLRMGTLRSVAETLSWRSAGQLEERKRLIIDPDDWLNAQNIGQRDAAFWAVGDVTFTVEDRYSFGPDDELCAFGVRFDPDGIAALVPPVAPRRRLETSGAPPPITPLRRGPVVTLKEYLEQRLPDKPEAKIRKVRTLRPRKSAIPVSETEVRDWFDALPPQDQARGGRWLWPEAKKHFRPRHVVRKLIEPFGKSRGPGRPRKAK